MKQYTIIREYQPTQTVGTMFDSNGNAICRTLELPWKDNERNISCIPEGTYAVVKQAAGVAGRSYGYFRFRHVPGRSINRQLGLSSILFHRITYVKDLQGCIGVGGRMVDLNKDGVPDMVDSSKKMEWMFQNLPKEFEVTIKSK